MRETGPSHCIVLFGDRDPRHNEATPNDCDRPEMDLNLPHRDAIRDAFEHAADRYDRHAALEQEVGRRLLERLEHQRREPRRILDLGCGTGALCAELKKACRKADVIGLDSSMAMLSGVRKRSGFLRPLRGLCADYTALPVAARSVDLVVSNLSFQWCERIEEVYGEIRRVLAPGGMLLFSSLGLGTFRELASAWHQADETAAISGFVDILEHGDALMAAGFQQPVMDAERITLEYRDLESMAAELEATGMAAFLRRGRREQSLPSLGQAYEAFRVDGRYPLSFEVVYGTAFGPDDGQPRKTPDGDVITFSVESLKKSLPGKS